MLQELQLSGKPLPLESAHASKELEEEDAGAEAGAAECMLEKLNDDGFMEEVENEEGADSDVVEALVTEAALEDVVTAAALVNEDDVVAVAAALDGELAANEDEVEDIGGGINNDGRLEEGAVEGTRYMPGVAVPLSNSTDMRMSFVFHFGATASKAPVGSEIFITGAAECVEPPGR